MGASIVTVANMKGGVGKTNAVLGLALAFATGASGGGAKRVLVMDLDAQANASFWLCGDMALAELIEQGKTIDAFLEDRVISGQDLKLPDYVCDLGLSKRFESMGVIPSSPGLRNVERELIRFLSQSKRSLEEIERVVTDLFALQFALLRPLHDIVLIDTGPGITALTQAAIRLSDLIVVPTVPDFISSLGLEAFCKTVLTRNAEGALAPRLPWVLVSRYRGSAQQAGILEELRNEADCEDRGFNLLQTILPDSPEANIAALFSDQGLPGAEEVRGSIMAILGAEILEVLRGRAA